MLERALERVRDLPRLGRFGAVTRVVGLVVEAAGVDVSVGELCRLRSTTHGTTVLSEVMGFHHDGILLMPLGELEGIHPGSSVEPLRRSFGVDAGPGLLGRIVNGLGEPIDGKGSIGPTRRLPLNADPPNPLRRRDVEDVFPTGVRALDGILTMGRGQRIGIFAGSGVGKSTLLGMIARHAESDVNVIALLGERGREVRDFLEHSLGEEGLARSVVIVATGDESALVRARGALLATSIAEYFRDEGKDVLLMLDSVTRVATAWREIGLAVGEPPTTRGYPPSVFASLPRLLERAGNGERGGITGIYTVLVEGDDMNEPVADHVRSILDGHVVLSRDLAARGHFPAIEITGSASRVRDRVVGTDHLEAANRIRGRTAILRDKEDLIAVGAYEEGADPRVDRALRMRPETEAFLRQEPNERTAFRDVRDRVLAIGRDTP